MKHLIYYKKKLPIFNINVTLFIHFYIFIMKQLELLINTPK